MYLSYQPLVNNELTGKYNEYVEELYVMLGPTDLFLLW
jgi:hypothetical protein